MLQDISHWLFDPSGLTPHGFCLLWKPGLIWTHAVSDSVIAIAYFTIPVALATIARRRRDLVFAPVFWLFSTFILLCGAGHWLSLLTLWVPVYGVEAVVKASTAVVSIVTAIVLGNLLPKVLASHEALLTDMTRSKANEAVLRAARDAADAAARAKSEFLATMSHEIRSPMSGLVGVLDELRHTRLNPEQVRMSDMMHHSAMGLLAVLNDILDFSKIESGALSIAPEPTNVRDLVTHIARPQQMEAARKTVVLTLYFAPEIPQHVELDPLRLRQIVNNLLSNAVKFTATGRIAVQADILREADTDRLRLAVTDTGIGMTAATLTKLFSPFMQADSSTTRDFGGTGLGLCISLRLAQLLGGTLTATSQAGVGSTFTLLLPLTPASPPRAVGTIAAAVPPGTQGARWRVLVADDDQTNRWLARRQLETLGMAVDVAENGEAAFDMLRAGDYDLLLTDCHMPRMDGVALTRAVRARTEPALRQLPIIGVTADVTEIQRERCLDAGMTDVVIKPLAREKLATLLARHLPAASTGDTRSTVLAPDPPVAPVFDLALYHEVFEPGDPAGDSWLAEFRETAERLDDQLRGLLDVTAPAAVQRDRLAATAHRLAGSALSVGATRLGEAARRLERGAAASDLASLRTSHADVQREFAGAKRAMSAFLAASRAELTL